VTAVIRRVLSLLLAPAFFLITPSDATSDAVWDTKRDLVR
jgi:hypothetical protein